MGTKILFVVSTIVANLLLVGAIDLASAQDLASVQIERGAHFLTPDGADTFVTPGLYQIEGADATGLRLMQPDQPQEIKIQASHVTHQESVPAPVAITIIDEDQPDQVHVVLLLPDGRGLDARGSFSGIGSRAVASTVKSAQIQKAMLPAQGSQTRAAFLYGISPDGTLKWYRHNGALTGAGLNVAGSWAGPLNVGSGWQTFRQVVPGGAGVLYAIAPDGTLNWYSHDDSINGTPVWRGAKPVGSGWQNFKHVFSVSEGILYGITNDGVLKWYRHSGYQEGKGVNEGGWLGPRDVGTGWQNFKQVIGACDGVIYAITTDGTLKWYRHTGYRDGTVAWDGPKDVGSGWQTFTQVFAACDGIMYAVAADGVLKWYKHTGYRDGAPAWQGPNDVGSGWQNFTKVVSLLPIPTPQPSSPPAEQQVQAGKWITWSYLAMTHPEVVGQALADVQAGKRTPASMAGFAAPAQLSEMLKKNWTAEVSKLQSARVAALQPAGVTTRGGSLAQSAVSFSTADKMASTQNQLSTTIQGPRTVRLSVPLPAKNMGDAFAGERRTAKVMITAPEDDVLTVEFDKDATDRRFRVVGLTTYTGKLTYTIQHTGGHLVEAQKVSAAAAGTSTIASIPVRAGQLVSVEIAFEPGGDLFNLIPRVGQHVVTLYITGKKGWGFDKPIRAYANGINFGVLMYAKQGHEETITGREVGMPIVLTNATATPITGTLTAPQLPSGVMMSPVSVSLGPQSTQEQLLKFMVNKEAVDGTNQPIVVELRYAGATRSLNLDMTIFHPWVFWCVGVDCKDPGREYGFFDSEPLNALAPLKGCARGDVGLNQFMGWIREDGQWAWKITAYNSKTIDVGGSDLHVDAISRANPVVRDRINVHIGPGTRSQLYERTNEHFWIRDNFFAAAELGFAVSCISE